MRALLFTLLLATLSFAQTGPNGENCDNFLVGTCPCDYETLNLDMIFVFDASNSLTEEEFELVSNAIGTSLEEWFPSNGRLGLMKFASFHSIEYDMGESLTNAQKIDEIKNLEFGDLGSGTWMLNGLYWMYKDIVQPGDAMMDPAGRKQIFVTITDGSPSSGQEPCEENPDTGAIEKATLLQDLTMQGVTVVVDGDKVRENAISCLGPLLRIESWSQTDVLMREILKIVDEDCKRTSVSPYNGAYSASGEIANSRPIYVSSENWVVQFDGEIWSFTDPANILNTLLEVDSEELNYPTDMSVYIELIGIEPNYLEPQVICCVATEAPSRTPSVSPSYAPSVPPTTPMPSITPSKQPTTSPTTLPSTSPSSFPTTSPTTGPTTPEPSTSPTSMPTTSPTSMPSKSPTSPPTTSPTTGPTTPEPTTAPTTSPTTGPTKNPSISEPTMFPTVGPSGVPSVSPTDCDHIRNQVQDQCEEDLMALKERATALNVSLAEYYARDRSCEQLTVDITILVDLLEAGSKEAWSNAVNVGEMDCKYVPVEVCAEVTNCQIDGAGGCASVFASKSPTATPSSKPSMSPTVCKETASFWQTAVGDGNLECQWVPLDVCDDITTCRSYNNACMLASQPCSAANDCNGRGTTTDDFSPDGCTCVCDDGYDGVGCSNRIPASVTSDIVVDATAEPSKYTMTVSTTYPYTDGKVYTMVIPAGSTYLASDAMDPSANCQLAVPQSTDSVTNAVDCALYGGVNYELVTVLDQGNGLTPYVADVEAINMPMSNLIEDDTLISSVTPTMVAFVADLENYNPDHELYVTVSKADDTSNRFCVHTFPQVNNDPNTYFVQCPDFEMGEDYILYVTPADTLSTSQGTQVAMPFTTPVTSYLPTKYPTTTEPTKSPTTSPTTQPSQPPIPALILTGSVNAISNIAEPHGFDYEIPKPFADGKIYVQICPTGVDRSMDQVMNPSGTECPCAGTADQLADGTWSTTCPLPGGDEYKMWVVADIDGQGTEAVWGSLANDGVYTIPTPSGVYNGQNMADASSIKTTVNLVNPDAVAGKYYLAVCVNGEQPTVDDVMAGTCYEYCGGEGPQQTGTFEISQDCDLTPGTTGEIFIVVDSDGAGSDATFLNPVPEGASSFLVPGDPVEYELTITFLKIRNCDNADSIQIAEFNVYAENGDDLKSKLILGPYSSNPADTPGAPPQGLAQMFDGDVNTKWLDYTMGSCDKSIVVTAAVTPDMEPNHFTFTTALDLPNRDPVKFSVRVCEKVSNTCKTYLYDFEDLSEDRGATIDSSAENSNLVGSQLSVEVTIANGMQEVTLINAQNGEVLNNDPITQSGVYAFNYWVPEGETYQVAVQDADDGYACILTNAAGTAGVDSAVTAGSNCVLAPDAVIQVPDATTDGFWMTVGVANAISGAKLYVDSIVAADGTDTGCTATYDQEIATQQLYIQCANLEPSTTYTMTVSTDLDGQGQGKDDYVDTVTFTTDSSDNCCFTLGRPSMETPYGGYYTRTGSTVNGYPEYTHSSGYVASVGSDGKWTVTDPSGTLDNMVARTANGALKDPNKPADGLDWETPAGAEYDDVQSVWGEFIFPTKNPTPSPTPVPTTSLPTESPTNVISSFTAGDGGDKESDLDGEYSVTTDVAGGKPVYANPDGYFAKFDDRTNTWTFEHPASGALYLPSVNNDGLIPDTHLNWDDGAGTVFTAVPINSGIKYDCAEPDGNSFIIGTNLGCWDERFTCTSCCATGVNEAGDRSCWTEQWDEEDCCGEAFESGR